MLHIRPSAERGVTQLDWLQSWHSFSFGNYYDPSHRHFGPLRVINEDIVAPGGGFATHPHDNMEIVTYILSGALEHKDSMGNGSVIRAGDIQRMSAGTGITHSEFNPSDTEPVHLLQIWFFPDTKNIEPSYAQQHISEEEKRGKLGLLASKTGRGESASLHQDVDIYGALLQGDDRVIHRPKAGKKQWIQVTKGVLRLNGQWLQVGDGVAIEDEPELVLDQAENAELVLFDMG